MSKFLVVDIGKCGICPSAFQDLFPVHSAEYISDDVPFVRFETFKLPNSRTGIRCITNNYVNKATFHWSLNLRLMEYFICSQKELKLSKK